MRVRGGVATEEEKQKLIQLQNQRTQKEKMLPDHAWLMEPCFPDVINEYIVDYVVNVRDAERFAKLVKSNSVMGFVKFISLALDDWPESDVFQKIAITPPDEELNDSEYYLGLMSRISAIKDIAAVEDVLLEREPIFQRYELELWRRIAIVLTDRGDIRRLYNSGLKYIRFLKEISEKVTIRDEAVDAIEAYCVGLHNAEAVDEYTRFSLHLSKSLPVNFQQMNSRGGQKQSKGTSQTRSYQGNQHIKNNFNHFKSNLQKSAITHHSIPSINTPINPSSNPSSHPP